MAVKISLDQIKSLREETGAGIMEAKKALVAAKGDNTKAKKILQKLGAEKIAKREAATSEGQVFSYVHHDGKLGALVKITCETDFVANSKEFQTLGREVAMQVASMEAKDIKELLEQDYIRDTGKTIGQLVDEVAVKVKEKLTVTEIVRLKV
jgi:elongation factor Ts